MNNSNNNPNNPINRSNRNNGNNSNNANTVPMNLNTSVNPMDALREQGRSICAAIRRVSDYTNSQKDEYCHAVWQAVENVFGGTNNQLGMASFLYQKANDLRDLKAQFEGTGFESMFDPIIQYAVDSAQSWQRAINGDMYNEYEGGRRKVKLLRGKTRSKSRRKTRKGRKPRKN
jgi:hypothetical protein